MSYVVSGHRCWREEKSFGWRRNRCRGLCCESFVAKGGARTGRKNRGAIAVFVWDERAALRLIPRGFLFELMEFVFLSSSLSFSPCLSFFFLFISYSFVHSQMCTRKHTLSRFHCLPQETKHPIPVEWWWWPPSDCKGVIIDEYPLADVDRWHILGLAVNETVFFALLFKVSSEFILSAARNQTLRSSRRVSAGVSWSRLWRMSPLRLYVCLQACMCRLELSCVSRL